MAGKRSIFEEVGAGATAPLPQGGVINRRGGGGAVVAVLVGGFWRSTLQVLT